MMQTLGYKWLPYTTVIYYANFQCGDFGTLLPAQIENPSIVWTPEIVDHVHDPILVEHQMSLTQDIQWRHCVCNSWASGYTEAVT